MIKKTILAALVMCVAMTGFAQDTTRVETVEHSMDKFRVETGSFWSNWYVSLGGGAQVYCGDHDDEAPFKDRLAPALDVAVGKWFTPVIGVRLMYSGLQMRGAAQAFWSMDAAPEKHDNVYSTGVEVPGKGGHDYWLYKSKFNMGNVHADVMFNLLNLFGGYNENRKWDLSPYVGLGIAMIYDSPTLYEYSGNAGLLTSWNFSKALALNLDIHGMIVKDHFDNEVGRRSSEGAVSATLGLTYKFKPRGWDRSKTIYNTAYIENDDLLEKLNEMMAKNEQLQKELDANEKLRVETVTKTIAGDYLVIFEKNKIELSNEARANLGMLATVIKLGDPAAVYSITGYADSGTGDAEKNEYLSKGRAENVYNCLINEFGINEKQLVVDYKGGVDNMFYDDPRLSRSVIISLQK